MVNQNNIEVNAVLTPPLSLESVLELERKAPNFLQRIGSLFKNVRPGSDLTLFQLPPLFNHPKSQLQCFGESLYCVEDDMLSKCTEGRSPLERFANVVAWSISMTRPVIFGVAPLNPILGETHHVSRDTLNVMLEQVSHHPPVCALHATDEKKNIETIWCHNTIAKFYGTSVEATVHGKKKLKLLSFGETYVMNSPNILIRLFPKQSVDWVGNVRIGCEETGLEAELCYKGSSFFGFKGNHRSVKGKIFEASSSHVLFEIEGHWDRTVTMKDVKGGKITVLYDAKKTISRLKTPIVKVPKEVRPTESAVVWAEVNMGILRQDWEKAREAKITVEEKQRELRKERDRRGETWSPKHFALSYTKEEGWEVSPKHALVPPAPILSPY